MTCLVGRQTGSWDGSKCSTLRKKCAEVIVNKRR
jgi:hypothetical protein